MIRIAIFQDGEPVREFEQKGTAPEITIGRAQGCVLQLDQPAISRLHALIRYQNGGWAIIRKANFGAILLNGQEIENAPLEGGEEITIGTFSLRVNIEATAAASMPTPSVQGTSGHTGFDAGADDGRTKFVTAGVSGLFRMEPGAANVEEYLFAGDLCVFGRGTNCDVVLTEKKASRKHFEVRKQGLSFFLKDLNSANGLMVNGRPVTEAELVTGDVIEIGETKIQFSVESKDYFAKQDQFLPVPAHLQQPMAADGGGALVDPNVYGGEIPGGDPNAIPGMAPAAPEPPKSLVGKVKFWYDSMPRERRLRIIGLLTALAMVGAIFGTGEEEVKPRRPPPGSKAARTFELLPAEKKKFVVDTYAQLLDAHAKTDYAKMKEHTRNILMYVDDYKDTKSYEALAIKGLDAEEEAKRKKIAEEEARKRREIVAALEEKGRVLLAKALDDPKFRPELESLIQEIYAKDPNNRAAPEWRNQIRLKEEEEKRLAEEARQKEELRQRAETAMEDVRKIFKEEKYIAALAEAEKLYEIPYREEDYQGRIDKLKEDIRAALASVINPLLAEAMNQRGEGGDLVKAKELYYQVLKVDATNRDALGGLDAIQGILHLRAKRFYAEAVLAESVSDLNEAKDKYAKCLRVAPDENDIYKKRCRGKLARFDAFGTEEPGAGGSAAQ